MLRQILLFLALPVLLSACTEMEFASHLEKSATTSNREKYLQQQGNFKVGKPYSVLGQTYTPKETYEYTETGIASWYGPGFHGGRTACGEKYNNDEMTAAHRTLQMPSLVRVTNLENGRSVIVRVNDRGPFKKSRVMDVSKRAAEKLGMIGAGTAKVKLELLAAESRAIAAAARSGYQTQGCEIAMNDTGQLPASYQKFMQGVPVPGEDAGESYDVVSNTPVMPAPVERLSADSDYATVRTPSGVIPGHVREGQFYPEPFVSQQAVQTTNIYVQAGAFGDQNNAVRLAQQLKSIAPSKVVPVSNSNGQILYKVQLGPLDSVASADKVLNRVISTGQPNAIITVR